MDATLLTDIDAEVQRLADEMTPELLPRLLERMLKRDALVFCERHDKHLYPYVRAQITLTHVKRNYYRDWHPNPCMQITGKTMLSTALQRRDEIRAAYRSTPCTCWVQHR